MTTTCENEIYHIDGPPISAFAIAEYPDGSGNRVEIVYRVIRFEGKTLTEIQDAWAKIFNLIQSELKTLGDSQLNPHFSRQIIWWRRRPEFSQKNQKCFYFYARFATTPVLPETFWGKFGAVEGDFPKTAEELLR